MAALEPLPMSQKKEDLIKHLNMGPDTYTKMANETDRVYKWLTSDKRHLKKNGKRKPPYDWSDIVENSKDEAMKRIAESGDAHTSYYWSLATPNEGGCPNWIARWFLYHKFRYRDGRNRNPVKGGDGRHTYSSSSKHSHNHHKHDDDVEESNGYPEYYDSYARESIGVDHDAQGYGSPVTASPSTSNDYGTTGYSYNASKYQYAPSVATYNQEERYGEPAKGNGYWDPVRDSAQGR